ncbi:MAG: hypothetical protein JWL95_599 [Gemmatimonadetes bacterium]|nr:hypothetical protein [Gemmatimonadota bacterium]
MNIARRSGIALALAGCALTLAASAPHRFSPGYTYRLKIDSHVTESDGKTKDFVVMSGRAMVNAHGGRLDIEEASRERAGMAEKGGYILYDPTSMMIVSTKDKKVVRFGFDAVESGMGALTANVPGMRINVSDVNVGVEKLGAGEPLLGMSTTRFRVTQDYKLAIKVAFMNRNSSEHIVQEYWMAEPKNGLANPFARMGAMRLGGGGFDELMSKTAEATRSLGKGMPLKTVTTMTSINGKNEKTETISTMLVTELHSGDVDDAALKAPADYEVVDMGAQMKAMGAQLEQARSAQAQANQGGQVHGEAQTSPATDSTPDMKAAALEAAKEAAKQKAAEKVKKGLGGFLRRP